jgi:hypothetical protein
VKVSPLRLPVSNDPMGDAGEMQKKTFPSADNVPPLMLKK